MILLVVMVVFAFIGAAMASGRNRSPFLWAVICFFTGIIGVIILAVIGTDREPYVPVYAQPAAPFGQRLSGPVASSTATVSSSSTAAWKTLKEFDADIREALGHLQPFGSQAEERLATAYLSINDKSLLPSIVSKIVSDEEQAIARREEQKAHSLAAASERDRELIAQRESRARETIRLIRDQGMTYEGRKVASVDMHSTDNPSEQGWAKIVFEDGRSELRAGSSFLRLI